MCYDIKFLTRKKLAYARRKGASPEEISSLEEQLKRLERKAVYHASGFSHPELPVFTADAPHLIQFFEWGLIPFWVKDFKLAFSLREKTLNARGETIFEKKSFKAAAKYRRCLVMVDGFYEHHHFNGKTYPYHIKLKNEEPMILAGLWETWESQQTGEIRQTVSIVTTRGNDLLKDIHNNPKLAEPRMPLILPKENEMDWLKPIESKFDMEDVKKVIRPFSGEMEAYTVPRIRGKFASGNEPKTAEYHSYPDLEVKQNKLF